METGTTGIAKACTYYNQILAALKLGKKYEELRVGDKVRFCYIEPSNKYGISCIAYKPGQWPKEFAEMKEIAKKLCKGMAFVRVDLYVHDGKVYFGEMTFHPAGGYTPITPREWEYKLGDMIKI